MRSPTIAWFAVLAATTSAAHHSDAGLDMNATIDLEGTVTEFNWRNPHVYFILQTIGEDGRPVDWDLQLGSTITLARIGWDRETLAPGDRISVSVHPATNGRPYGLLESFEKDGVSLPASFTRVPREQRTPRIDPAARATTLEGLWMADTEKLVRYPGGFDGFFSANLVLTEKAVAAQAAYDPMSPDNPEARCIGRPIPGMIISSSLFPLQIEIDTAGQRVLIKSEFYDEERVVHMDGRGHPDRAVRTLGGHSIGRWEGDTLVVDTRNFADHRSPYQIGVPSGAQKHVTERYRLLPGGTRAVVEFTLEDPEYLAEPLTHSRELIFSPELEPMAFDCDAQATRRFLP